MDQNTPKTWYLKRKKIKGKKKKHSSDAVDKSSNQVACRNNIYMFNLLFTPPFRSAYDTKR